MCTDWSLRAFLLWGEPPKKLNFDDVVSSPFFLLVGLPGTRIYVFYDFYQCLWAGHMLLTHITSPLLNNLRLCRRKLLSKQEHELS